MRAILCLVLVAIAGCLPSIPTAEKPKKADSEDLSALANHRFWKTKVNEKQVGEVIDRIVLLDRGEVLAIDETFSVAMEDAATYRALYSHLGTQRRIVFDMSAYEVRPGRQTILDHFAQKLDEEEFRPKRKRLTPESLIQSERDRQP